MHNLFFPAYFSYFGYTINQGSEPVQGTKTKTNEILTGTEPEPETKSNFIVPNRIKNVNGH